MASRSPRVPAVPKPTFEEAYDEVARIVASRKRDWTYTSVIEWADISQELLIHISKKWHLYIPTRAPKLEHWVNTVITNALFNERRKQRRYQRPCVGGGKANGQHCTYNRGGDNCSAPFVASKTQCDQCPLYAEWAKKRQHQFHIQSNVALENHAQEVSNMPGDFTDAGAIKEWLDGVMEAELNRWEGKVYRVLFVRGLKPAEASEWLLKQAATRKRPLGPNEPASYQACLTYRREFEGMMRLHLKRAGHIS